MKDFYQFILDLVKLLKGKFHYKFMLLLLTIGGLLITQTWTDTLIESIVKESFDKDISIGSSSNILGWILISAAILFFSVEQAKPLIRIFNRKKEKDCKSLNKVLKYHNTTVMRNFIDLAKYYEIDSKAVDLWEFYSRTIEAENIIFHNKEIKKHIENIYLYWKSILGSFSHTKFLDDGRMLVDRRRITEEQKNNYFENLELLDKELKIFYRYIHNNYHCINFDTLDKESYKLLVS